MNSVSRFACCLGLAGLLILPGQASPAAEDAYWAVAYRAKGSGWGAAKASAKQEAVKRAKAECEKTEPKPGRHYTNCILSQSFSVNDDACVHLFEAFSSSFALFVGSSYGARTGNAAREAAEEAHERCLNTPGFTNSICGSFVRPSQKATYCSRDFR